MSLGVPFVIYRIQMIDVCLINDFDANEVIYCLLICSAINDHDDVVKGKNPQFWISHNIDSFTVTSFVRSFWFLSSLCVALSFFFCISFLRRSFVKYADYLDNKGHTKTSIFFLHNNSEYEQCVLTTATNSSHLH